MFQVFDKYNRLALSPETVLYKLIKSHTVITSNGMAGGPGGWVNVTLRAGSLAFIRSTNGDVVSLARSVSSPTMGIVRSINRNTSVIIYEFMRNVIVTPDSYGLELYTSEGVPYFNTAEFQCPVKASLNKLSLPNGYYDIDSGVVAFCNHHEAINMYPALWDWFFTGAPGGATSGERFYVKVINGTAPYGSTGNQGSFIASEGIPMGVLLIDCSQLPSDFFFFFTV